MKAWKPISSLWKGAIDVKSSSESQRMWGLIHADFLRLICGKWIWIAGMGMLALSLAFVAMQHSGMDYVVGLDRVVFLPLSFYGSIAAALVSLFIGDDFSDGCIRNKIIIGRSRISILLSGMLVSCIACIAVYLLMLMVTVSLGLALFENNVETGRLFHLAIMGACACCVYGCIYSMITFLIGRKTSAVVVCMMLSFGMLFLALHTNQVLVQEPLKNGAANPHYVSGAARQVYTWLHDLNPTGQAAQLSRMDCSSPLRWMLANLLWLAGCTAIGTTVFAKKNIR